MPPPFVFDRSWRFDCPADRLWERLADTDEFPTWWSWLDAFESEGLRPGGRTRFSVRPPLPYRLHLEVVVDEVRPCERVVTTVGGDLSGPARLELVPDGDATTARMVWSLELRRPLLVAAERVARPVMVWGHDRVVDLGVEQFRRRVLGGTSPAA